MNTLPDLTDAFDELERRADDHAATTHPAAARPTADRPAALRRHRSGLVRLAPLASGLAVLAVAIATVSWVHHSGNQAGSPGPSASPTAASAPAPNRSGPTSASAGSWSPPSSAEALARQARAILTGTATISVLGDEPRSAPRSSGPAPSTPVAGPTTVPFTPSAPVPSTPSTPATPVPSGPPPSAEPTRSPNGASIRGLLTADGRTGGYDLTVFRADPSVAPSCADVDLAPCRITRPADGGFLLTQTVRDRSVPGGVTVTVERLRADGADILMHLSTEQDPKGSSTVTTSRLPLPMQHLVDFVSSEQW